MIFRETRLKGAFIIEPEKREDHRGFLARTWCTDEFGRHRLETRLEQCSIAFNRRRRTLRGLHYQAAPFGEAKLVRCTVGSIYDVILDLRPDSPTFGGHIGVALSAEDRRMLYVPKGFAQGFQTLEDDTEVFYQMSQVYAPKYARGVRWNDPAFGVVWPLEHPVLSERDRECPDFRLSEARS